MEAKALKAKKRFTSRPEKAYKIQSYGDDNGYPQQVVKVVDASCSGKSCYNVYAKFVQGGGFSDKAFYQIKVNDSHTSDDLLAQISADLSMFGGFALHVNWSSFFEITSISHVPLEHVRFYELDDNGEFDKVAIHPDWTRENIALRKFKKEDIDYIDLYDPSPDKIQSQVNAVGGWENYKGQVYYYSNRGNKTYPLPIFDSVLTDMSTEEGVSNVSFRNVRFNFFPSTVLINKRNESSNKVEGEENTEIPRRNDDELDNALIDLQGDENTGKIFKVDVENEEEIPEFKTLETQNYDKQFEVTEKSVVSRIGRAFTQPPILRSEDVGNNFGANAIKNAYDFYNSVTTSERYAIERVFKELFAYFYIDVPSDLSILPLVYNFNLSYSDIPKEFLDVLTVDEKRKLLGYEPLPAQA